MNESEILSAIGDEGFREQAQRIVGAEMEKLVAKYGEPLRPLLEIFCSASEVLMLIKGADTESGTALGAGIITASFRSVIVSACKLANVSPIKALEIAQSVQDMHKDVHAALDVAARVHTATSEARTATLQ